MSTIAELMVKIAADNQPLRKELNATKKQIRDAFGSSFLTVSETAKTALAGIGAGIVAIGIASVKQAANLQRVTTAFTNMLGSAEKSATFIKELQNFAAKTPFEFNQVTAAAQKFLAFGFTAEQVIPTLTAVGNAAAGVGLGADGVDRVTLALGQMAAKSRVQSDEMLQLTEAGIPAWKMLADSIGTTVPEAMDKVSKGMVDAQTGISALVSGMQSKFGGMMEQQSEQIGGAWSNMMDGIDQSLAQIGLKIADAFNLTDVFSRLGEILTSFANAVSTAGIAEAFREEIPDEFQVAIIALSATLVGVAIPALALAATSIAAFAAPLIAAVTAFAPVIAAVTALAGGFYYLYQQGLTVQDVLQFLSIKADWLSNMFNNLKQAVSAAGNLISTALTALQPAFTALLAVGAATFSGLAKVVGFTLNAFILWVNTIATVVTNVANFLSWMFECVKTVFNGIADVLSDATENILPDWAKNGIKIIGDFVNKAVGFLNTLIRKITDTNDALNEVDGKKKSTNENKKTEIKMPSYEQFKTSTPTVASIGGSDGNVGSVVQSAAQASKHIEDEWFKTFQTQSAMVDKWYREESNSLEKSAAMNVNYERDKQRLAELYSQKRADALAKEAQKELEIKEQVRQLGANASGFQIEAYGSASQQKLAQMEADYNTAIANIESRYAGLTANFISMTEQQKQVFLAACREQGIAFEVMENGMISFSNQAYADKLAQEEIYQQNRIVAFKNAEDIKADLQDAYNTQNLEKFMEVLNEENALRLNDLTATQDLMNLYQEAYLAAHASTLELIAQLSETALGGLSTAFTDILMGAKSAKQAFADLGKAMIKTIVSFFAQQASGMLVTAVLGDTLRSKANAKIAADAAQANAAWAPAAWSKLVVEPSAAGVATGLLTEGLASAGAMATATQSILGNGGGAGGKLSDYNMHTDMSNWGNWDIPGFAHGGYFKGATIGVIGEGPNEEVALPLSETVFNNLAKGIVEAGGGAGGTTSIQNVQNVYGDINNAADLNDLYNGFNEAIAAGLRGA